MPQAPSNRRTRKARDFLPLPKGASYTQAQPVQREYLSATERRRLERLVGGNPLPVPSPSPLRSSQRVSSSNRSARPQHDHSPSQAETPDYDNGAMYCEETGQSGAPSFDLGGDWGEEAVRHASEASSFRQSVKFCW